MKKLVRFGTSLKCISRPRRVRSSKLLGCAKSPVPSLVLDRMLSLGVGKYAQFSVHELKGVELSPFSIALVHLLALRCPKRISHFFALDLDEGPKESDPDEADGPDRECSTQANKKGLAPKRLE